MRWLFVACLVIALQNLACAHDFKMKVGKDTFVFDFDYTGKLINVYEAIPGEVDNGPDRTESIAHDWFAVEDLLEALPYKSADDIITKIRLSVGRTGDIGANAFAAIYNGKRYIVMSDQIHSDYTKMTFVMGHELGHHLCGHTAGNLRDDPWAKELEADTFAGLAIRSVEKKQSGFGLSLKDALSYASQLFSTEGSTSHPPAAQRMEAIIKGYKDGSPCVGRVVKPITTNELGGALRKGTDR